MILDANGKPSRGNTLITPSELKALLGSQGHDWEGERRLRELHNSIRFSEAYEHRGERLRVGDTIRVRVPKRYER